MKRFGRKASQERMQKDPHLYLRKHFSLSKGSGLFFALSKFLWTLMIQTPYSGVAISRKNDSQYFADRTESTVLLYFHRHFFV